MLRSIVVVSLLLCLGLFAQVGIASTNAPAVYAASDHSALAPPGVIAPNSVQTEILMTYRENEIARTRTAKTGTFDAAGLTVSYAYIVAAPQRQDFL